MRNRIRLVVLYNAPLLSPHGMSTCPWRKGKRYDLHPGGVIEPHTSSQGHSGDRPAGKRPKHQRIRTGPVGSPNGTCLGRANGCRCGKHNRGNANV